LLERALALLTEQVLINRLFIEDGFDYLPKELKTCIEKSQKLIVLCFESLVKKLSPPLIVTDLTLSGKRRFRG